MDKIRHFYNGKVTAFIKDDGYICISSNYGELFYIPELNQVRLHITCLNDVPKFSNEILKLRRVLYYLTTGVDTDSRIIAFDTDDSF